MRIKDLVVLITGGASGLGASTARRLTKFGARVVIADMNSDPGEQLVEELGNDKSIFIYTDVSKEDQVKNCVEKGAQHFNKLDALVNFAGNYRPIYVLHDTKEHMKTHNFNLVMNAHVLGTFLMMKYGSL